MDIVSRFILACGAAIAALITWCYMLYNVPAKYQTARAVVRAPLFWAGAACALLAAVFFTSMI